MATLDQLRLEQLLQPFNNQTGIVNTNQALPMINNNPFINTGAIDQRLQNTDLIQQIIEQNQQKLNLANTADTAPFFFPPGGTTPLESTAPLSNLDLSSLPANMGVANEEDVEQEFLPDQKPSGIAKLFEFLGKLPTPFNLARRGLGSLRGLNDRIQGSDFGQATSLMDYLDMRKYGGLQGRNNAAARNMAQARGITKSLASRPSSTSGGYQKGPGGSGAQSTGASKSQSQAGPGFSGSGSASEMGSF